MIRIDTGRCDHCPARDLGWCHGLTNPRMCQLAEDGKPGNARMIRGLSANGPAEPARPRWAPRPGAEGPVSVGFLRHSCGRQGGVASWHDALIPALDPARVRVAGEAVLEPGRDDGEARDLASRCEVLVCCGLDPAGVLPAGDARPCVVMVGHGQAGDRHTETWMEAARKTGDRWAVVHACGLPTVPIEHRDRAEVLENGYDPSRVESTLTRQEARARLGLDPGVFAIGFIGRLASEKRPELLTGAIRHLDRRRFRLVVAGDGPARLGDYGQTDRVLRLGWRDDVADILAALDCLASPSEVEGFGLSMVEAMAAGVPVVGTPRGVLATRPELARIVPVEDGPAEWARALAYERLEAGPRAERAEKARGVARRTWSPEAFGRRWSRFLWRAARVHPDAETAMDLAARRERNQALGGGCGCHGKAVTVTAAPVP